MNSYCPHLLSICLILTSFICRSIANESPYNYGLSFKSHSFIQDERTSLDITPAKSLSFSDKGFSIGFDLKLKEESHTYGYVFRIMSGDTSSFDFISLLLDPKFDFILNENARIIDDIEFKGNDLISEDKWFKVNVKFTQKHISVFVNGIEKRMDHSFKNVKDIRIVFGRNDNPKYYTTDVPPVTLRDVVIRDGSEKVVRAWKLDFHNEGVVLDQTKKHKAIVKNGIWEIDRHLKWEKVNSVTFKQSSPQIAFDEENDIVFIVLRDKIYTYSLQDNQFDSIPVNGRGRPYHGISRQIIYNPEDKGLISYSPDYPDIIEYDFETNEWSGIPDKELDSRQHHNKLIDERSNQLITFGGYGHHLYNAELSRYDLNKAYGWQKDLLDSLIYPRYLSALGLEDENNVLILGGYGSPSGKQEESPRNFYDLYRINIRNNKVDKLWELPSTGLRFTFSNSMIVDTTVNKLYVLAYNNDRFQTFLYLCSFPIETKDPEYQIVSDSIQYNFLDIKSYSDLFLSKRAHTLYTVFIHEQVPEEQTIEIYSLAFPPLPNTVNYRKAESGFPVWLIIPILIFFVLYGICTLKNKKRTPTDINIEGENDIIPEPLSPEPDPSDEKELSKASTVFLFGGFQVFDKYGNNITGNFSPTLKSLFLFLLLSSVKNGKGTTSQDLDEKFWFDMSKSNASNNRRVNIRKLRLICEEIGDINLTHKNGYWYLEIGEQINCDYKQMIALIDKVTNNKADIDKEQLIQIVNIALQGQLLPDIDQEWADDFKAEYSGSIVDILLNATGHESIKNDLKLMLRISDAILIQDTIDENAIKIKCHVLYKMGQKGQSKFCFDRFVKEYNRLLNSEPGFSYEGIIS